MALATDKYSRLLNLLANTGDMALKRRAVEIISSLDIKPQQRILEIGCGDGFYLHLLSQLYPHKLRLTGTDINPRALISARKNLFGRRITLIQADVTHKLPFPAASFDRVIMSEVMEHLSNDLKGLSEAYRVLKPGGRLVITVPNLNYPFFWDPLNWLLQRLFHLHVPRGFWAGLWNQHLRLYTPSLLLNRIQKARLNLLKIQALTYWCLPFNHYLLNFMAIRLHSGQLSARDKTALNKFSLRSDKRSGIIALAFNLVNFIDRFNDVWQPKDRGVGIIAVCLKSFGS